MQDAVYASCALPGYFPPGRVGDRLCVDGGVDRQPARRRSPRSSADLIIAVDVGSTDLRPITDAMSLGFANIYMRAATTMMHALQQFPLTHWDGPPMVLIRPRCGEDWLSFANIAETIREGHRAAHKALEDIDAFYDQPGGVYPRRRFELEVDRDKCIGCGLCVSLAPNLMGLDAEGKAYTRTRTADWSPADGDFVHVLPDRTRSSRGRSSACVPLKAGERGAGVASPRQSARRPRRRARSSSMRTYSSSRCATWIEPGPNRYGVPQFVSAGMSVANAATDVAKSIDHAQAARAAPSDPTRASPVRPPTAR